MDTRVRMIDDVYTNLIQCGWCEGLPWIQLEDTDTQKCPTCKAEGDACDFPNLPANFFESALRYEFDKK